VISQRLIIRMPR